MTEIPMRTKGAWNKDTIPGMNAQKTGKAYNAQNLMTLQNRARGMSGEPAQNTQSEISGNRSRNMGQGETGRMQQTPSFEPRSLVMQIPSFAHPIQKGQKVLLSGTEVSRRLDICLGWNSTNEGCDVDVSAFLLGENGKVIGDDWFVFYGQTKSPDGSVTWEVGGQADREVIHLDIAGMNPAVRKVVFVLTINEAFEKKLHFGMLKDAYIRILDHGDRTELVSFQMTDYYTNVISMMIGEIYLHNNNWKFHGIGNGVAKDLAGLCELYGVQVSNG